MVSEQRISIPLPVGSWVELYEDVDMDSQKGSSASILFEGTVAQYSEETALLRFEENDTGLSEFEQLLEEADGFKIYNNYE